MIRWQTSVKAAVSAEGTAARKADRSCNSALNYLAEDMSSVPF